MKIDWSTMPHDDKRAFVSANLKSSATQIAAMVNGATRNAIIGFCHRNKLQLAGGQKASHAAKMTKRAKAAQYAREVERQEKMAAEAKVEKPKRVRKKKEAAVDVAPEQKIVTPEIVAPEPEVAVDDVNVEMQTFEEHRASITHVPVSILNLTEKTCRWPLNHTYINVPVDEMMFCGRASERDHSLCTDHRKASFGGKYSGGKVVWKAGEGPQERKVMKQSVFACRG